MPYIPRFGKPRGDEGWPATDFPHTGGFVDGQPYPWDYDEEYAEELAKELQEQLARKRPIGFQSTW